MMSTQVCRRLSNRNAVRKIKNGSPKIREILRDRCRQRIKEKRDELFCRTRLSSGFGRDEVRDELVDIVRNEFFGVESMVWESNEPQLDMEEPFEIPEENEIAWIFEEYDRLYRQDVEGYEQMDQEQFFCPICQRSMLQEIDNNAVCNCGVRIPLSVSFQYFKSSILEQVETHQNNCLAVPKFAILSDNTWNNLCMQCGICGAFAVI